MKTEPEKPDHFRKATLQNVGENDIEITSVNRVTFSLPAKPDNSTHGYSEFKLPAACVFNLQQIALADDEMIKQSGAAEKYRFIARHILDLFKKTGVEPSESQEETQETWYSKEEIYHYLKARNYSDEIAEELSGIWSEQLESTSKKWRTMYVELTKRLHERDEAVRAENDRLKKIILSDKETHERAEYSLRKRCEDLESELNDKTLEVQVANTSIDLLSGQNLAMKDTIDEVLNHATATGQGLNDELEHRCRKLLSQ